MKLPTYNKWQLKKCAWYFVAHIPGELHRKTIAASFWEMELKKELQDRNLMQKWFFLKKKGNNRPMGSSASSGTKEEAIEYILEKRTTETYKHECYEGCKIKGKLFIS